MSCVTDVANLVHNRANTLEEFKGAIEGIRSYIVTRNGGNSFSKKLADQKWRDEQIGDLFSKVQSGKRFFELTDHPLLRKLVKRKGKNEDKLAYIREHIVPCYLDSIKAEPHEKLVEWVSSLNAAFIDPANLQHQMAISNSLPPEFAERLLKGKQTISMGVWKLANDRFFSQNDILVIVALINKGLGEIRSVAPSYFAVLAYESKCITADAKQALMLSLQGVPYNIHQLADKDTCEAISAITDEFREVCLKNWLDAGSIPLIAKAIDEMNIPVKSQIRAYYAFQYLRLIHSNAPYQSQFYESTVFGLQKLSQDPRIVKP